MDMNTKEAMLQRGHLALNEQFFAPVNQLDKFPYKFIPMEDMENVADAFFNAGKFWEREWHLYYVWPLEVSDTTPLILVSESQFLGLLEKITATFPHLRLLGVSRMDYYSDNGLLLQFPEHPRLTPRCLGCSTSKISFSSLTANAPRKDFQAPGEAVASDIDEDDRLIFENLVTEGKCKGKESKTKRRQRKQAIMKNLECLFKRVQRYLGLRKVFEDVPADPTFNLEMATEEKLRIAEIRAAKLELPPLKVNEAAPYPFVQDGIFIAVDVEAWERDHRMILEIGIAILDTKKLASTPLGKNGVNWFKSIEARHILITEHEHIVNKEFVAGNPRDFRFGESESVSIDSAVYIVSEAFDELAQGGRPLFLVGHNVDADIKYLDSLGFDPVGTKTVADTLDTQLMWRAITDDAGSSNAGLGRLLGILEVEERGGLHNAGNDAVYTIQAMIAMVVLEGTLRK